MVWGQVPTVGFPFSPLSMPNPNSKTTTTVLSISSDPDSRISTKSGLLDSTIKILFIRTIGYEEGNEVMMSLKYEDLYKFIKQSL